MDSDNSGPATKKVRREFRYDKEELWNTPREQLIERVLNQQQELEALQGKQATDNSLDELRETVEKLKLQVAESNRQESVLMMRLAAKEREVQELEGQIADLKQAVNPSSVQLQSMLLDPAINLLFVQMKREMDSCRNQLEQSQKDLAAWKFTPDSQTGKRLMAKCRMLIQENEELGRTVSSGRLAKLEGDIALQKRLILEMKSSEKDTEEFLGDVDEDLEALQGTVYLLQQELKDAKERIAGQQREIDLLRTASVTQLHRPVTEQADGLLNEHKPSTASHIETSSVTHNATADTRLKAGLQNCERPVIDENKSLDFVTSSSSSCNQQHLQKSGCSNSSNNVESMDFESIDSVNNGRNNTSTHQSVSCFVGPATDLASTVNGGSSDSLAVLSNLTATVDDGGRIKIISSTPASDVSCRTAASLARSSTGHDCTLMPNGMDVDSKDSEITTAVTN